jgi:hypothetical protein
MMRFRPFTTLPSLLLATLLASGCGEGPAPTLFILKETPAAAKPPALTTAAARAKQVTVALGPISVPDYLDRTDFVRRASGNRLDVSEKERWAETVRAGLLRVLAADLTSRLGPGWWVTSSGDRGTAADLELPVDVETFEADAAGQVVLTASWEIRPVHTGASASVGTDESRPMRKRSRYARTASPSDVEDQIRALSANLGDLATELAASLAAVRP